MSVGARLVLPSAQATDLLGKRSMYVAVVPVPQAASDTWQALDEAQLVADHAALEVRLAAGVGFCRALGTTLVPPTASQPLFEARASPSPHSLLI